jgi:hypothetical protein
MHAMQPDDLYGLPLDRFIPERTALARALRADKQRDDAAAVAALRKPSVAAWAVNQLVRSQGAGVKGLFDAGDALRGAQADLLAGRGDGRSLRTAGERERAAVDELVQAARGLLTSEGHELSPAVVERVADTLHAAALDEDARERVCGGCLERELRHAGLGLGETALAQPPAAARSAAPREPAGAATRAAPREPAAAAKRAERERADARRAARTTEAVARRRAERSKHALRAAEERRARAAQALEAADEAAATARTEAREAADAHARAQADLEKL